MSKVSLVINYASLCGVVGVFGIIANVIIIAVFIKQGINNTMTISFLGLAIADILSLLSLMWVTVCLNPFFKSTMYSISPLELVHLTAGWPRSCFADVTSMITAFVTGERCLCVFAPLKVKNVITPRRSAAAICTMYLLMVACLIPEYVSVYFHLRDHPTHNLTTHSQIFESKRIDMEGITSLLYAIFGLCSFLLVIIFTSALVWKLKRTAEWRQQHTSEQTQHLSARHQRTIKMTVLMAIVFIISYVPSLVITVLEFAEPAFSILGHYDSIFFSLWSVAFICEAIDSSTSIIFYYLISSKFKQTIHEVFRGCIYARTKV